MKLRNEDLIEIARSKKSTAQIWAINKGWLTSLQYAFTEQGIYMLILM